MGKSFDYKYTCPEIDKQITMFKDSLSDNLLDLISELNPMFADTDKEQDYREAWVDTIYSIAEECFEGVRKTNEDMRKEAEYQIEHIAEERDEYERLKNHWESESEEKDKQIEDLKEEIENLKYQIENLIGV